MNNRLLVIGILCAACSFSGGAQILVRPKWVNANTTGVTTAFLTFTGVGNRIPVEAIWCGEVMDAAPDLGQKPVPGTIFGRLPVRFDLSTTSATGVFTDIMSIPASVTRRAYQAAVKGATSTFFYVRRFVNTAGGPDEYVSVTCEMSGGGALTPFSITDIRLAFADEQTLLSVKWGEHPTPISARVTYTGTGQLKGRWELVRPGDEIPSDLDLLTEATLPIEQRAQQKRYTEIERFDLFLPPGGEYHLRGPEPSLLPTAVSGLYMILLRIEAVADNQAQSDFAVAAGSLETISGGAAGFPIPPLRYFVGSARSASNAPSIDLVSPADMTELQPQRSIIFGWREDSRAAFHRFVIIDPQNKIVFSAILKPGVDVYRTPPWLRDKVGATMCSWSVEALDEHGDVMARSEWRTLRFSG